jgi:hypothetical protein
LKGKKEEGAGYAAHGGEEGDHQGNKRREKDIGGDSRYGKRDVQEVHASLLKRVK